MSTKIIENTYDTIDEAHEAIRNVKSLGTPGYSEAYFERGPIEVKYADGSTRYKVQFMMYYG